MADKKQNDYFKFITARGKAIYPRLNKPDTGPKDNPHEPQFKVALEFDPSEKFKVGKMKVSFEEVKAKLEEMRDALFEETVSELKAKKKGKALKDALDKMSKRDVFVSQEDDDGNETGMYLVRAKMYAEFKDRKSGDVKKRSVPVFDASGDPLKKLPNIGGGSVLKVSLSAKAYYNSTNGEVGVTFYIDSVQLIELVEFGGRSAADYGFEKEDGYSAKAAASDDDDTDEEEDDSEEGDDADEENEDF